MKCPRCKFNYKKAGLFSVMGTFLTEPICAICALEFIRKDHHAPDYEFSGKIASSQYRLALRERTRKKNYKGGGKMKRFIFEETGERRAPRKGEWYIGSDTEPVMSTFDHSALGCRDAYDTHLLKLIVEEFDIAPANFDEWNW